MKVGKLGNLMLGLVVFFTSCEKSECDAPEEQPVFFEYNYINHAWGYHHHGWMIDGDGYVRYFESPDSYRFADSTGYLSLDDMEYNLGQADSIIELVDSVKLDMYVNKISGAAEGEIGKSNSIAADAGASVLTCYQYDEDKESYRRVFLAQSGDWEQFNLSSEAEELVLWLRGFGVFWLSE